MSVNPDQAKGRMKQAVGDLADNKDLKKEGKLDERAGNVKALIKDVKDRADIAVDRSKAKVAKK